MAKIYRTNGDVENVEPKNGTDFQLEELSAIVGRRIIDKKFSSKKEAMKYVCNNYYNIKFNKITSYNV